jgi:microcystin-dependent protein
MSILFDGVYENPTTPWWSTGVANPANIEASTITINSVPAGNILLTHNISSTTELNAPLIFQRPAADINAPSESLVMNTSLDVPTKPVDGEYITATKASGTAYDDIAVAGLQIYGDQTTSANSGAHAYITGEGGNLVLAPKNSVMISSLQVSSLQVVNVISTTAGVANSYTANLWMSTPVIYAGSVSTSQISTNTIRAVTANISTINVSTLNAPNFAVSTVSSLIVDTKLTLTSTLSLTGSPTNINLGLGDVIQGLVGGAATQALGVGIGGAGLITGAVALTTGRTSGGVNSNVFQTVNGSTQLQFSTIGSAVSSIFLTVNSPNPLTTPGLEISTTQGVAAGTYCVRSVGDPLYINNNVSSIQMYGQWVPVIQPTATIPGLAISSLAVSSVNGAAYPPPGGGGIPSTLAASTITINGNQTQSGTGTFNWGGNTMSPTQVVLARPTSVNATLTTTGAAFLNSGATVNAGLTVGSGLASFNSGANVSNGLTVIGGMNINGTASFNNQANFNQNASVFGGLTVNNGSLLYGSVLLPSGSLVVQQLGASVSAPNFFASQTVRSPAISTTQISTANINLTSINGAPYSPGGGSIPSTLQASTITFDGGLTNIGSAPITTNALSTNTISTNTITTNALSTNTISTNTITTNALSTNTISTNTLQSLSGTISSFFVSSINNAAYPPGGGGGIPSTLNASTINANGGIEVTNGRLKVTNGFLEVANGALLVTAGGVNRIDGELNVTNGLVRTQAISTTSISSQTITSQAISTTYISSQTITASNVGCFQISSLTGSIYTLSVDGGSAGRQGLVFMDAFSAGNTPAGNIKAVGNGITTFLDPVLTSYNIQNGYTLGSNRILSLWGQNTSGLAGTAQFFSTLTVCANPVTSPNEACIQTYPPSAPNPVGTVISKAVSTLSIQVSTINGVQIPGSLGVPVGSITIWAGGSDNNFTTQNFNIPTGWLICDGSFILNSIYPALASVLGPKYGYAGQSPPPGTTALPDLTFAVPMGTPYRNYNYNIIPSIPSFSMQCTTSDSAYNTTSLSGGGTQVSSLTTWYITGKVGPALNYGSLIPGNQVTVTGSSISFPNMYISSIIQYGGAANDTGYIVLRSVDGSPIPRIPGTSTINAVGQGTAGLIPGGDAPYYLGSPNANGNRFTTRNQRGIEVGAHQHRGTADYNILGSAAFPNTSAGTGGLTAANYQPYVSTFQSQNMSMPTAPNFLNMAYIIKF